jgi:hypothetical protein
VVGREARVLADLDDGVVGEYVTWAIGTATLGALFAASAGNAPLKHRNTA